MSRQTKPLWQDLSQEIQKIWIQQTYAFYPAGSTTLEEATELARHEYEQSESDSAYPPVDSAETA